MLVKGMVLDACTISTTPATAVRPGSADSGSSSTLRGSHTKAQTHGWGRMHSHDWVT